MHHSYTSYQQFSVPTAMIGYLIYLFVLFSLSFLNRIEVKISFMNSKYIIIIISLLQSAGIGSYALFCFVLFCL